MTPPTRLRGTVGRSPSRLRSLSVRLFLSLSALTILAFASYAFLSIRSASAQWQETVHEFAWSTSDLIQRSTHYDMLHNRKDGVFETIRIIAQQPSVVGVRIFNKNGEIIHSAHEEEIGRRVDLQGEACVSCHKGPVPLETVPVGIRSRVFTRPGGNRVLGLINPIENAPECYNASCHAHPESQSILGVLDVTMSMAVPDARLTAAKRAVVIAGILIALLVGAFSAVFIALGVGRPVRRLIEGAEAVADGDLDTEIEVRGTHEMGQLARAFNAMTGDLRDARKELTDWSGKLESRLKDKTEELSRTQREVTHMEKMASLGKLAATVAHELNNPLAGILNYSKLVDRVLDESECSTLPRDDLHRYLHLIQKEAARSGDIVRNLLIFARRSGAEFARQPLNPILDRASMLVRHHTEMTAVRLETTPMDGDQHLVCDADQVQQALVALMVNAIEAMPDGGTLTLSATGDQESVRLTVGDTGVGIPREAQAHIFEPFFSSKQNKDGAGLGLAVVYGIVQRHSGQIDVRSKVGEGTTFTVVLPRRPKAEHDMANRDALVGSAPP